MDDDSEPDRAAAAQQFGTDKSHDQGRGKNNIDAVYDGKDQGAADDPKDSPVAQQLIGNYAPEEQLLAQGGEDAEKQRCQDQRHYSATATFSVYGLRGGTVSRDSGVCQDCQTLDQEGDESGSDPDQQPIPRDPADAKGAPGTNPK